jgi:ERF superfamily
MNRSESIKELAAALAKAQGEFPPVPKNRTAEIPTKTGGKYSYKYADLSDLIAAVTPALSRNSLAISQDPTVIDGKLCLETMIMHASGEWKSGIYPLQSFERPQEMGSEITYARRYTMAALLGVHAEEDEDGALASNSNDNRPHVPPQANQLFAGPKIPSSLPVCCGAQMIIDRWNPNQLYCNKCGSKKPRVA